MPCLTGDFLTGVMKGYRATQKEGFHSIVCALNVTELFPLF